MAKKKYKTRIFKVVDSQVCKIVKPKIKKPHGSLGKKFTDEHKANLGKAIREAKAKKKLERLKQNEKNID